MGLKGGSKNGEVYLRVQPQRTLKKTPEKGFLYRKNISRQQTRQQENS